MRQRRPRQNDEAYDDQLNALMPLLLMKGGGFDDLFGGLFDEDDKDTEDIDLDAEDDEDLLF